jgi:hypothetical protein
MANANGLARHYDKLTAWERVPLLVSACLRGDQAERDRLLRSAPRQTYTAAHHAGVAHALNDVADVQLATLLGLAADYWHALYCAGTGPDDGDPDDLLQRALMLGYLFRVELAGWRRFCAALAIDPEALFRPMPGYDALARTERMTGRAAFVAEGADAFARRHRGPKSRAARAEDVCDGLRALLRSRTAWWGCDDVA